MPLSKANKLLIGLAAIAILGFADASYLSINTSQGEIPPCAIGGCDIVLQSEYAKFMGIPLTYIGTAYYGLLILLIAAFLMTEKKIIFTYAAVLASAGSAISLFLVYLQLFVIKSLCLYCLVSAGASFSLFALSLMAVKTLKHGEAIH